MAAHFCGSRAPGRRLRQGRRRTGRGRQQSGRCGLDRAAAAAAGAGRRPRRAICRRDRGREAQADPARDRQARRRRAGAVATATRWPGPSTSAAPTSPTRRCRCPMRWCRRTAGRPCSSITASSRTLTRDHLEQSADVAEPDALTPTLTALAQGGAAIALDNATAADALEPPDRSRRRQAGARQRSRSACSRRCKNATEIEGTRTAHRRDAVALARFLAWIDREAPAGTLTEIDAVEALESFRATPAR